MSTRVRQLLAVALLAGGVAYVGAPAGTFLPPEPPAVARPAGQDGPRAPAPLPKAPPRSPAPVAPPVAVPEPIPEPVVRPAQVPKENPVAAPKTKAPEAKPKDAKAKLPKAAKTVPKQKRAVGTAGSSYCDNLRRRMAQTPKMVFSCEQMKAARSCERPGDRANATAAQLAKGAECYFNKQL